MSKGKSIAEVVKDELCTGCGTCIALCPCSAIRIFKDNSKGAFIPKLDEEKCNQCGICYLICPGHSVDFKRLNMDIFGGDPKNLLLGNYLNCYVGYATDYDIRYNASSGGLVTSTLIFALEEGMIDGALVTRMKADKPLEPEPFIARTKEEIISASKSKYCPVPMNIALKAILQSEGKYAVVGLPCHLQGIRKAEKTNNKLKERIALHLGIFCSGTPNFRATEFMLHRLKLATEEIKAIEYRGKGWPGNMTLQLNNAAVQVSPYPSYWKGFGGLFFSIKCKTCLDWFAGLADISFGDAWLPKVKSNDKIGTSIIICRNNQADTVLQQMVQKGKIHIDSIDAGRVSESQNGLANKKMQLITRYTVAKLFGRKIPTYGPTFLETPSFYSYLIIVVDCLGNILASKRSLWWLLDIYITLLNYGSHVKKRMIH